MRSRTRANEIGYVLPTASTPASSTTLSGAPSDDPSTGGLTSLVRGCSDGERRARLPAEQPGIALPATELPDTPVRPVAGGKAAYRPERADVMRRNE
jgi:hypothetical protein